MTAHAIAGDREKSLKAGMDDHVTKPIDPDALFDALLRWIKPGRREVPEDARPQSETDQAAIEIPEIAGVDTEAGLRKVGGNKALYMKLLGEFHRDYIEAPQTFDSLMAVGENEEMQRMAHTLKGVAGNIGADALYESALAFEAALKTRDMERITASYPPFRRDFGHLLGGLAVVADQTAGPACASGGDGHEPDMQTARELMRKLNSLLRNDDSEAEDHLHDLRCALAGAGVDDALKDFMDQVEDIEYEDALATLKSIATRLDINL
jgi:HPt (histidine-containing phosphotransfer) domain-containing protein